MKTILMNVADWCLRILSAMEDTCTYTIVSVGEETPHVWVVNKHVNKELEDKYPHNKANGTASYIFDGVV